MDEAIQKNMNILMGADISADKRQLSADDKKRLSDAYFKLFFGLAGANWARGEKTLGAAWYDALGQINAMIAAKNKSNRAAMYLAQIHAAHNTKWSQIIMTHRAKDKILEMSAEQTQAWNKSCAQRIAAAMNTINADIARWTENTPATAHAADTKKTLPAALLLQLHPNKQRQHSA